ncbi:MAG: acyl-CoA reductase, partial [Ferruginibacter sp.]
MNLQYRVDLLIRLGEYMLSNDQEWETAKSRASYANGWFSPEFVEQASKNVAQSFLSTEALSAFIKKYDLQDINPFPKSVGIVMAGNIP